MKKVLLIAALSSVALFAADGKAIYDTQCKSCHGADGKMKALGKSAPLAGQSAAVVEKDLEGYKAGTLNKYGMGGVMKGNASKLSADDMKAVASYIATLK
jgi:cytochrome c553